MKKAQKKIETISDDLNPEYLFCGIATSLLADIISGKIDLVQIAKNTMKNRGLDETGKWIGSKK